MGRRQEGLGFISMIESIGIGDQTERDETEGERGMRGRGKEVDLWDELD